jgi:glycolate oxidase iron-sulfur subunit
MPDALRALQASLEAEREGLLTCVHCGFCLPACPTYRRLGDEADSPRGRLHLMRAVAEGRLSPDRPAFQTHIDRCLGCRACEPVCPSGVPYGHLLEQARAVAREHRPPHLLSRLVPPLLARRFWSGLLFGIARWLRNLSILSWIVRKPHAPRLVRRSASMLLATRPSWRPSHTPIRRPSRLASRRPNQTPNQTPSQTPSRPLNTRPMRSGRGSAAGSTVVHLDGCVQRELFGHVNQATYDVLASGGFEVREWNAGCCGALHAHAGDLAGARALARRNIKAFEQADAEWVAVNAAGCGAALKDYGAWFDGDPVWAERARRFAAAVRDVVEFGAGPSSEGAASDADDEPAADVGLAAAAPPTAPNLRVAWDPPCHQLHAQGIDTEARRFLAAIPGIECVDVPRGAECCGGAGLYGITHPELGDRITEDKLAAIESTGCTIVATANPGCMMQIGALAAERGIKLQVVHPIELLAWHLTDREDS